MKKLDMLAVVYGIQRYHSYLYARPLIIISDQKRQADSCCTTASAKDVTPNPRLQV